MTHRVLHVLTLLSADGRYGGPQTVARTLRDRFDHDLWGGGAREDFALPDRPGERRFRAFGPGGDRYSLLAAPGLWWALWLDQRRSRVPDHDVVHVHTGPELIGLVALVILVFRRAAFVVQPHGMFTYPMSSSRGRIIRWVLIPLVRRARITVALTDAERALLIDFGLSPDRVRVIANGVDVADFDEQRVRVEPRTPCVAFIGRLHRRKHPERFTAAAVELYSRGCSARFVMAGADQGALATARAADPDNIVDYMGALTPAQSRRLMAEATVVVVCSDVEPFGLVAIEALAAGAALVITMSCDLAAELGRAGAATVTDIVPEAIADGIQRLLTDAFLSQAQRRAGAELVRHRYAMALIAEQWVEAYGLAAAGAT